MNSSSNPLPKASTLSTWAARFSVGLLCGALVACSGDAEPIPDRDPRFEQLAATLKIDLAASTAYGVSVAIMEDGVVTYAEAFGSKDADGLVPLTPETLMQIGSTTKQMTAVALLRKVEAGQIALTDSLDAALPNLTFARDATWDTQVTMHHLLSHQGALVDIVPWAGPADDTELAGWHYNTYANDYWLMAPPGTFWNYSNPHFMFAGLVTQELDNRFWPDLMREDIFLPLGMDRTFSRKIAVEADGDFATSYGIDPNTGLSAHVAMSAVADPGAVRPAGMVWTTPTQMMNWASFLMQGDTNVLGDTLRAEVTAEQVDTGYQVGNLHYGYGVLVSRGFLTSSGTWYQIPVWEHGGNTLSFSNFFFVLPEQNFAVAICASGYAVDFSRSVSRAVTSLVSNLPAPSLAPAYSFDPAALDNHVGTYNDAYNVGTFIITRVADELTVQAPDLDAAGITYTPTLNTISSDIFLWSVDGQMLDLTFIPQTNGGPQSHYIRNRVFVTTRVPMAATTTPRPTEQDIRRALTRARLNPLPLPLRAATLAHTGRP